MAPTLYSHVTSPAVRAVLMTAKAIGLDLNMKEVNLLVGEHITPAYLKLNPLHTVPTLVDDDGFVVFDSHAIITYLVSKYAKDDSLYPKDLKKRAIVDQRLHFESGIIFARLAQIVRPIWQGKKTISQEAKDSMVEGYSSLEKLLEGRKWAAGDFVSVADYSLISSVGSIATLVPVDAEKFPNVTAWMKRVEQLPAYEANKKGLNVYFTLLSQRLEK